MQEKEYAVVALKDILHRAFAAVEKRAIVMTYISTNNSSGHVKIDGWDSEFAAMSREEQVEWLLRLFEVLIEHG